MDSPAAPAATPGRVATLLGILFGLTAMGSSAVAVVLPLVERDLGLDTNGSAWVLTSYVLAIALTTPVYGRVADLVGVRRPLQVGVALMAAGAVVSATAASFPVMVLGRLLQGTGAGAVPVLATDIVSARFAGAERGRTLGLLAAVISIVAALGPLLGGVVDAALGWRWVFGLSALGLAIVPSISVFAPRDGGGGRLDVSGAALTMVSAAGLILVVQSAGAGMAVGAVGAAFLLVGGPTLVAHVRGQPEGFLPRSVVTNPVVVRASLAGMTIPAAYFGALLTVPALLASEQGWVPLQTGVAILPAAALGALASRSAGPLMARVGRYRLAAIGVALAALGVLTAAVFPGAPVPAVAGLAGVFVGFGLGQPALIDGISSAVDDHVRGVALGFFNLLFLVGGGLGSAIVGGLAGLVGLPAALGVVAAVPLAGVGMALSIDRSVPSPGPPH